MIYLIRHGKAKFAWMPAIPMVFYSFVTSVYFLSASFILSLDINVSYMLGAVLTIVNLVATILRGKKMPKLKEA